MPSILIPLESSEHRQLSEIKAALSRSLGRHVSWKRLLLLIRALSIEDLEDAALADELHGKHLEPQGQGGTR